MKLSIVSQLYYPDNFRINEIVQELASEGHTVDVLTGLPDYATGRIPKEYHGFKRRRETIYGAQVRRVSMTARRTGNLCRALNYGTFLVTSSLYALFCKKSTCNAIFVYEISPVFQIFPGIILKKRTRGQLVVYCCDLWPESLKAWGMQEAHPIYRVMKAFSGWLYRQCDVVAITSKPFREYLVNICGVDNTKIVYLPQHCEDDYADIASQYEENDCVDFLFAGNIGAVQDVHIILKAVAKIKADKSYIIHIVGNGYELPNCRTLATELELGERVIFHGRYPSTEMKRFYNMADCFLLTLRGGDFIGMTLPAKLQGYLCAGKPIVAAIDGAGRELIAQADCGEAVPAGDIQALADRMTAVIANFDFYKEKGRNGRMFYERHYTKQIFMDNLNSILKGKH